MKRLSVVLFFGASFLFSAARSWATDTCVECHSSLPEKRLASPVAEMREDTHARQGISCADCHGGDPKESDRSRAESPSKGFLGRLKPAQIPKLCARCHSSRDYMRNYNPSLPVDQYDQYLTSGHGRGNQKGDTLDATCVSCHGGHGIKPGGDTRSLVYPTNLSRTCGACHSNPDYMKPYNLTTDQAAACEADVHGVQLLSKKDFSAPACNGCHGNHGSPPASAKPLSQACIRCHPKSRETSAQSPHREAFAKLGLSQCETCHRYHDILSPSDGMVGLGPGALCADCHDEGTKAGQETILMRKTIEELKQEILATESLVNRAEKLGDDVSEARFILREANSDLIEARTTVHLCDPGKLKEISGKGSVACEKAVQTVRSGMNSLNHRRRMVGLFAVFVLLTAIVLALKIRPIEARQKAKG